MGIADFLIILPIILPILLLYPPYRKGDVLVFKALNHINGLSTTILKALGRLFSNLAHTLVVIVPNVWCLADVQYIPIQKIFSPKAADGC